MAAQVSITLTETGSNMPENSTSAGPITDTVSSAVVSSGQSSPTTSFSGTAITVPSGATQLELFTPSGNTNAVTISQSTSDAGWNLGTAWTWAKIPVSAGTVYIKSASGSGPVITWKFR